MCFVTCPISLLAVYVPRNVYSRAGHWLCIAITCWSFSSSALLPWQIFLFSMKLVRKITYFSFSSQGIFSYVVRFFLSFLCTYFFPACMALTLQLSRSSCCLRICFSKADFFCVSSSYLPESGLQPALQRQIFFLPATQYVLVSHPCQ